MHLRHFSPRTEQAYLGWMRRYHEFRGRRDPAKLGADHVTAFLNALATRVRAQRERDLATGGGWVELPGALAKKLPSAGREWLWQWVFPATRHYVERETRQKRRHHLHETVVQHAVRRAVLASGIPKRDQLPHPPPLLRHAPA